ncbi:Protein BRICK1 [Schistosoma japonicum]|uniref:Protein BRICK1 n=1 Tax=Schistosoma japonicum TaxID=6182 RepID=A0A4Z2D239_SCHJA|nr:Protein BRICK1 [Schistosoma japonicum]
MTATVRATKEIRDDWGNREKIDIITTNMKSLVNFLNRFDSSCRIKISQLDSKLNNAEKHIDLLEAHVHRMLSQQNHQRQTLATSLHSPVPDE